MAVDAVTGATGSSNGILNAVKDCVVQAGGDPVALNKTVAKNDAQEEYTCDVVVVGAGTSGCNAAARAANAGADVILIDKAGTIGGTGVMSFQQVTTGSVLHDEAGMDINTQEMYEDFMSQSHWTANGAVLSKFLETSEDNVNWLMDMGFELVNPVDDPLIVAIFGLDQTSMVNPNDFDFLEYAGMPETDEIHEYFEKLVSEVDTIMTETTAHSLIQDENGNVTGVVAEKYDGTTVTIHANAVVMCTGGFAGSEELQEEYMGGYYMPYGLLQNDGEGLQMMWDIGAAQDGLNGGFCCHVLRTYPNITDESISVADRSIPATFAVCPTTLRVDTSGARFMDESQRITNLQAAANAMVAAGPCFYTIVSGEQIELVREYGIRGLGMDSPLMDQSMAEQPLDIDYVMENIDAVLQAGIDIGLPCQFRLLCRCRYKAYMIQVTNAQVSFGSQLQ